MKIGITVVSIFIFCAASSAQEITSQAHKLEGNTLTPISNEEAACGLIRQQTIEATTECDERQSKRSRLSPELCLTLNRAATAACDSYAQSFLTEPASFAQCIKASDRHRKCALVITAGCEYTKSLAQKLESIEGTKDVDFIVASIRSECTRPDALSMAIKAHVGLLRVLASPRSK